MFEPLPDVLRLRRKELKLTQEKLALKAKVSRQQLALLEGGHNVSLDFLIKITNALELSEVQVGPLRLVNAPPYMAALLRVVEAVRIARRKIFSLQGPAATLDDVAAAFEALRDAHRDQDPANPSPADEQD